jgi:uncharacterized membrane protein
MTTHRDRLNLAGILLGIGLGGFFDGIVFHQLLQWHHMISSLEQYPTSTVAGLEANTFADGMFHVLTFTATVAGVTTLWQALRRGTAVWSTTAYVGAILIGWGVFNVVEVAVNHLLLELHRTREDVANPLPWDIGVMVWGAAMIVVGIALRRSAGRERFIDRRID